MDYRIIKLKLSNFDKEYIYKDKEKKIIATYDDKDKTKKALYTYDLNKKIKDKFDKVNKVKIKDNIEKKLSKKNLSDEEIKKQAEEQFEKSLNEIKSKITRQEENRVVLRDTELIRIIRTLNLKNNNIVDNGYININDIVCVSISTPIYKTIQNGIIIINDKKFIRLMASSGNVRNKKVFFISLDLYDKAMDILLCGLSKDLKHKKISKFNAYMGLPNSDTIPVTTPRIIVISDYKNKIEGTYNVVTKMLNGTFDFKPDQKDVLKNMPFDGAGLCSVEMAQQWQDDLKLDYLPSSFQFRAIIGVKGNLYVMDIKKYITEMVKENERYIIDAWGNRQEVINKDGELLVDAILTESQFKFKDYYDNFEEWKTAFETDLHGYHRTFNIAKYGNKENKNKVLLSYQPIQSLVLTDEEIKELCEPTIKIIDKISNNVNEFLKYRGLLQEEKNELGETILVDTDMDRVPPYYKALKNNKNLFKDKYIQKKVQVDIKRFKENASKGMVFIDGNYQTLTIDLVGFMEVAMRQEIKGAVSADEVYSKYWLNKNKEIDIFNEENKDNEEFKEKERITELDIIRFPHIAQEHCLVSVIQNENDWFKYIDDGIIVSMWDSNNQKLGSADSDGDRVLNTTSKVLINAVKRQPSNCILFKEEKDEENNNNKPKEKEPEPIAISNIKELIECDCRGMDASIGKVVNKTTILWSIDEDKEGLRNEYINVISVVGALVIDFVKTGVKEDVPKNIEEFIKDIHKPKFLKVKYKTLKQRQERVNKNVELVAKDEKELNEKQIELFSDTDCTMNKLHDHVNEELENIKSKFPKDAFKWTELLKYKKLNIDNDTYPLVVAKLKELKEEHDWITKKNSIDASTFEYDSDKQMEKIDRYKFFYRYCKNQLINLNKECKKKDKLLDYVIYAFYADKDFAIKNESKDLLWNVFESELNIRIDDKREFKNTEYNVTENEEQFKEQMEKLKIGKDKVKEKALQVSITGIDDLEDKNKIEVKFPKEKVFSLIDKLEISRNSKKLLMVLVMLNELYKVNKMELIIEQSKRGTLNKSALAKLTGLNIEKIQPSLRELFDSEYIQLNIKNNKEKVGCEVLFDYESKGNVVKIKDSSSIQKNMKKLTFQK